MVSGLAGWKRERLPVEENTNWISVVPDWICQILSQSTYRLDKVKKMPITESDIFWLMDPLYRVLDAYRMESGKWVASGSLYEDDKVRVEPFQEIEFRLGDMWLGLT